MTPAEVGDAVFTVDTRDVPSLKWMPGHVTYPWEACFDGERPYWYINPAGAHGVVGSR